MKHSLLKFTNTTNNGGKYKSIALVSQANVPANIFIWRLTLIWTSQHIVTLGYRTVMVVFLSKIMIISTDSENSYRLCNLFDVLKLLTFILGRHIWYHPWAWENWILILTFRKEVNDCSSDIKCSIKHIHWWAGISLGLDRKGKKSYR